MMLDFKNVNFHCFEYDEIELNLCVYVVNTHLVITTSSHLFFVSLTSFNFIITDIAV